MGEVRVEIDIENDGDLILFKNGYITQERIRATRLNALVDTGAVMILLPQDVVDVLGLEITGKTIVSLANEQKIELNVAGTLSLRIKDRMMKTDCLVGPPLCEPLLGQLVLERLDLIIDPLKQTLTPRPESPYLPSLKLKYTRASRRPR